MRRFGSAIIGKNTLIEEDLGTSRCSDGSLSGLGDKMLYIYVYEDASLVGSIFVSSAGKIAVNEKSYRMENAEQFIGQIIEIMGQPDRK